jgi:hypothetical protein
MKKIFLGLSILAALGLQANDTISTNMNSMRDGLQSVQDGFLYNNKSAILEGIEKITKANEVFHNEASAEAFLPKDKKSKSKIAYLSTNSLNIYLAEMKEYVIENKIVDASSSLSGVMHSCTRCHAIVRGW